MSIVTQNPDKGKAITQGQAVLKHLQLYGSITSWEAITDYHITRVGAVIYELKRRGHNITSERETNNGKHYTRYILGGTDK
jgi:hypothetical protein